MHLISLQSGSSGNCIYVESDGVRLLFDAGLSASQVAQRLELNNKSPLGLNGLFISHNHSDHVRCAAQYTKKFDVPLFISKPTLAASKPIIPPEQIKDLQHFRSGDSVKIGHVTVETIQTPHDAADGVIFVVDDGNYRLGICTDFGHPFLDLKHLIANVDGLFLESNYDRTMLANGSYPRFLKERISGPRGHISNLESAELVARNATSRLQWLYLAHLSEKNNTASKALATHRKILGDTLPIFVTNRYAATQSVSLDSKPLYPTQLSLDV